MIQRSFGQEIVIQWHLNQMKIVSFCRNQGIYTVIYGDFMCFVWEVNPSIARWEALMIVSDICICAKTTSLSGWQRRTRSWMATSILCKEADTQNMRFLWDICWRLKEQSPSPLVHPSHPHRGKSRSELPPRDLQRWKPCCGPICGQSFGAKARHW